MGILGNPIAIYGAVVEAWHPKSCVAPGAGLRPWYHGTMVIGEEKGGMAGGTVLGTSGKLGC